MYRVVFNLVNTASKTILLRSKIPGYESVVLAVGEVLRLNTTVPSRRLIFINIYDAKTNQRAYVQRKSVYIVVPKLERVPYAVVRGKFFFIGVKERTHSSCFE